MYRKSLNAKCLNYKTFRRPFSLIGSVSRLAWPCCHELNLFVHILCAFLFQVLVSQGWRKVRKLGEGEQCDMHNLPTLVQCKMNYSAITKGGCPLLQACPLASPPSSLGSAIPAIWWCTTAWNRDKSSCVAHLIHRVSKIWLGHNLYFAYFLTAITLAYTNKDFCTFLLGRLIRKLFNINTNIVFIFVVWWVFGTFVFGRIWSM